MILAVTSYFNPFGGQLRRRNFDMFRRYLGIPLLAVEWSRDDRYDLGAGDADHLLRVTGGDLVWQKERLLNIGLARARELGASIVVFLDCDIVFERDDWHQRLALALESATCAQCYRQVDYLPEVDLAVFDRDGLAALAPEHVLPSMAFAVAKEGRMFAPDTANAAWLGMQQLTGNPGMAFALRIDSHPDWRFYEGNLVGGGDLAILSAMLGRLDELFEHRRFSAAHQADIRRWAARHAMPSVHVAHADVRVLHLWHGTLEGRGYIRRWGVLADHDFDPARDIDPDRGGALRLVPGADALRERIAAYLGSRRDS